MVLLKSQLRPLPVKGKNIALSPSWCTEDIWKCLACSRTNGDSPSSPGSFLQACVPMCWVVILLKGSHGVTGPSWDSRLRCLVEDIINLIEYRRDRAGARTHSARRCRQTSLATCLQTLLEGVFKGQILWKTRIANDRQQPSSSQVFKKKKKKNPAHTLLWNV